MLQGHERAITQIKYNREGDLLFSAGKDHRPNVWYSINGERLGTFNGHQGVVWCIDVDWTSTRFLSGGGDRNLKLWDCETGKEIGSIESRSSVRTCNFSYSANMVAYSTDKAMKSNCEIFIIDTRDADGSIQHADPIMRIMCDEARVSSLLWGTLDETLITGHEDGEITQWDLRVKMQFYIMII